MFIAIAAIAAQAAQIQKEVYNVQKLPIKEREAALRLMRERAAMCRKAQEPPQPQRQGMSVPEMVFLAALIK